MKLLLHIGSEKTGSSFLQTISARNRPGLILNGIFFPEGGKREQDMLDGKISPGNGKILSEALRGGHVDTALNFLQEAFAQAKKASCTRVLISNENLVELSIYEKALANLLHITKEAGFDSIETLLVLRDPVDQALSLFKHRAKSGKIPAPKIWIRQEYDLFKFLERFFQNELINELNLVVRRYSSDAKQMFDLFFRDWLLIDTHVEFSKTIVNPSLTLSELLFLQLQYEIQPFLVKYYYRALLSLDRGKKDRDDQLEKYYRSIFALYLERYSSSIQLINSWLPANEQLQLESQYEINRDFPQGNLPLTLSEEQVKVMLRAHTDLYSFQGQLKTFFSQIRDSLIELRLSIRNINRLQK